MAANIPSLKSQLFLKISRRSENERIYFYI